MKLNPDPGFPKTVEDQPYLAELSAQPVRPVFIMGLHRSGTTFLYDCVARCFPLAQLSLYHLFYFDRLLKNFRNDVEARDKARLNACFQSLGIVDRKLDTVPVNADEVEEYGFLLRQHSGKFRLNEHNADLFKQLCQKLMTVQPGSEAVLLKNPWDTGNAAFILQHFPNARFVYITREPIDVLNSMMNALLTYLDGPQHYLELLLSRGGSRKGYRLGYGFWWLMRKVRQLLGEKMIGRMFRPMMTKQVVSQVVNYRRELASLAEDCAMEVDYLSLSSDPEQVMRQLAAFLDLPLALPAEGIAVRQRKQKNAALDGYQAHLEKLIAEAI
ncbi:sulfotransferase [Spongiibacter sp. KMU-158]|uniref:Sulfotransferase n=1 Tax=Spongiibacter pelagi TaxID=2760804 RepID=A0A927GVJ5_9GAMM|nr:sulfotransferase [Spongiibacter pelagi]MBD2857479.1 sulfotransferase [Spongiibacter pelagi]